MNIMELNEYNEHSGFTTITPAFDINKIKPCMALVFYENEHGVVYAESMKYRNKGGFAPPKPVRKATINKLVSNFKFKDTRVSPIDTKGVLPSNIICLTQSSIVWYHKPKIQRFMVGKENKAVKMPYLIFKYDKQTHSLHCWATKTKPSKPDTKLYMAPFTNIYNGKVCMGTAKIEYYGNRFMDIIEACEIGFFGGAFTGIPKGTNGKSIYTNNEVPTEFLFSTKQTLYSIL